MSFSVSPSSATSSPAKLLATLQQVVFSLGSNCQQEHHFRQALDALQQVFGELVISSVYDSPPAEKSNESSPSSARDSSLCAHYYNAVVVVKSDLSIVDIKKITQDIERQCSRDRTKTEVTIDVDFLLYGNVIYGEAGISLPHQGVENNAYVLRPLADLLPDMIHPQLGKTFLVLWQQMLEHNGLLLIPVDFVWQDRVVSVSPPCLAL
ncbi:MAG: 2-amino-4-hydroxy-6-hydroxymethyldihydropteridine diphosphokinase [Granulosicoccus sp.]|jgi:2-amino-4-hydroxy-6-hydroxymethyldihydropteridine diphosphokinase